MFLIAGLILLLAGSTWFTGAVTVGWILTIVGCVEVGIWLLCVFGMIGAGIFGMKSSAPRNSRSRFR